MSNTAVVVPSASVQGNISSCQILNQLVKTDLPHWYSFVQVEHYESFNTCTGQAVAEYDIPSVNSVWALPIFIVIASTLVVSFAALCCWFDS